MVINNEHDLYQKLKEGGYLLCFNSRANPDWSWSILNGSGGYGASDFVAHVPRSVLCQMISSINQQSGVRLHNFWVDSPSWSIVRHDILPFSDTYLVLRYML